MSIFINVFINVISPMFLLIIAGVFLHRKFAFNLQTFSHLLIYFLLPIVCFKNVYEADMTGSTINQVIIYLLIFNGILIGISIMISKIYNFDRKLSSTFQNGSVLSNSANFGLPVSSLVFSANPLGLSIQIIIAVAQNILTYTWGFYNSVSASAEGKGVLKKILKLPILHALILALIFRYFHITIPEPIYNPLNNAANAFVAVALITLGAQIAYIKIKTISKVVIFSSLFRLLLSPVIGLLVILMLGVEGTVAQALFISSSFPSNRSASLLALEYDNYPEVASSVVVITTISSCFTVAFVIYLSQLIF
ncbi:AEC family transporter [Planococcus halotolerans]|uniref:AEC family transporter n=1 Tax=Planococcus halotolerans TaxID=2233542 RepID=UPI0013673F0A|nr:AEC family transporter [Planococcus halotolerans]QHJ70135.1 AEC family transporter [Planococcus halotolerans]